MVLEIIRTDTFLRTFSRLDSFYINRIEKLIEKIIQNPEIGKPMKYERKGTREVYLKPFRLSYIYEKSSETLIFLAVYHKKKQ